MHKFLSAREDIRDDAQKRNETKKNEKKTKRTKLPRMTCFRLKRVFKKYTLAANDQLYPVQRARWRRRADGHDVYIRAVIISFERVQYFITVVIVLCLLFLFYRDRGRGFVFRSSHKHRRPNPLLSYINIKIVNKYYIRTTTNRLYIKIDITVTRLQYIHRFLPISWYFFPVFGKLLRISKNDRSQVPPTRVSTSKVAVSTTISDRGISIRKNNLQIIEKIKKRHCNSVI